MMKVAISLPDPLFDAAERLAEKLEKSRSALYSEAIAAFVERHDEASITAALDAIYEQHASTVDDALARAQLATSADEAW